MPPPPPPPLPLPLPLPQPRSPSCCAGALAAPDWLPASDLPVIANVQCAGRAVESVERQIDRLHGRSGRRVAVIGHSRGGHYARALGHRRPELVSHAISLGAGLRAMLTISYPPSERSGAREALHRTGTARSPGCFTEACDCAFAREFTGPFRSTGSV